MAETTFNNRESFKNFLKFLYGKRVYETVHGFVLYNNDIQVDIRSNEFGHNVLTSNCKYCKGGVCVLYFSESGVYKTVVNQKEKSIRADISKDYYKCDRCNFKEMSMTEKAINYFSKKYGASKEEILKFITFFYEAFPLIELNDLYCEEWFNRIRNNHAEEHLDYQIRPIYNKYYSH